mmetsp:Transcript_28373/g.83850  ORF Transcript_28373/g.83850 Transcript_28373/m.83850 type:complete len:214 (-) Transcript_28373:410-1051(-)
MRPERLAPLLRPRRPRVLDPQLVQQSAAAAAAPSTATASTARGEELASQPEARGCGREAVHRELAAQVEAAVRDRVAKSEGEDVQLDELRARDEGGQISGDEIEVCVGPVCVPVEVVAEDVSVRRLVLDDRVGPRGEGVLQQPHQRVRLVGLARKPRQLHPKVGAHPVWAKQDVADIGRRSGDVDRRVLMEDEPVDEVRGARTRGDKEIKPAG